jgi:hypothetical protein
MRTNLSTLIPALVVLGIIASACNGDSLDEALLVFNGEANRLNAYAPDAGDAKQTVVERRSSDPNGWDMNGQICFDPDGSRRFIAGEDTGQPNPPPGWGFFQLHGSEIGELSATRTGKLTPTYQSGEDNAENFGCGFLSNGTLVTTDVGNQAAGPGNGQLILWFPPFDRLGVPYCKLDIEIGTAGGIYVDDRDRVYVTSARVASGVYRYSGPFPTSNDAAGGCGRTDSTGAPLADRVQKDLLIPADVNIPTPSGIARTPSGGFYVSSVFNGVIAEFDAAGTFLRRILEPPSGEVLGPEPYSTGSPFGIGVDSGGTIYYADIGIVIRGANIGPGPSTGKVRRIRFVGNAPQAPETLDSGLDFPDGIGILED